MTSVDKNGQEGCIILEKIDENIGKDFYDVIEDLKEQTGDDTLKGVDHYDIIVIGKPEFDVNVSLDVLGITSSSKVFILLEKDGKVTVVEPTIKDGKVIFDLGKGYDKLAIVTDGKTASDVEKENNVLSPQTGDVTPYVVVVMAIMAMAIAFISKKVKA
jgi:hypothetical protein